MIGDFYQYRKLKHEFTSKEIEKYQQSILKRYKNLTEDWDTRKNTEWLLRNYLAVKMILSASVMLTSLEYAKEKNIRIVEPYLLYYALLTSCRSLLFTIPDVEWNNGEIVKATHNKIINIVSNQFEHINQLKGKSIKNYLNNARDYRELYSYKFPATGLHLISKQEKIIELGEVIELATLISELAQFNSEKLQYSIYKNYKEQKFEVDKDFLMQEIKYNFGEEKLVDADDRYRLDYILRKQQMPLNLYWTMTEGLVEDFFDSWCAEEDDEELYNPDSNWNIIFSVP